MTNSADDSIRDRDLLRVLAVFHWVFGGLALLAALVPTAMVIGGVLLSANPPDGDPEATIAGAVLTCLGAGLATLAAVYGVGMILAGRGLWSQKRWVLCLVMAAVTCILFPYGTVLGVLSVAMLAKNGVRARFPE